MKNTFLIIWLCFSSSIFANTISIMFEMTNGKKIEAIQANLNQDKFVIQCVDGVEINIQISSLKTIYIKQNSEDSPKEKLLNQEIQKLKDELNEKSNELQKTKETNNQLIVRNNLLQSEIINWGKSQKELKQNLAEKNNLLKENENQIKKKDERIKELETTKLILSQKSEKFKNSQESGESDIKCEVLTVKWAEYLSDGDEIFKPDAKYMIIALSLENKGLQPQRIPLFGLVDEDNYEYKRTLIHIYDNLKSWSTFSSHNILNPNIVVKGLVLFDVPTSKKYKLKVSKYDESESILININNIRSRGINIPTRLSPAVK